MPTPSHPRWGRPIEFYASIPDVNRSTLSVDAELAGLQAMQKITQLATESTRSQTDSGSNISVSTLEDALRLSVDPLTIGHLANASAISGCIQLMKAVSDERPSHTPASQLGHIFSKPFSYEYGHLCFMLLVSCLNICLLDRWNQLDKPRRLCTQYSDTIPQVIYSNAVGAGVLNQFEVVLKNGGDCDWVLGWSVSTSHRRQTPLLSQPDISTLLAIVWNDRKLFVRAQALTQSTPGGFGLSGLMFVFSRYLLQDRGSFPSPGREALAIRLNELILRYNLVAPKYQRQATLCIVDSVSYGPEWTTTPRYVDTEDSRFILSSFIKQLSDGDDPDILVKRDPSMMLRFVPLAIDADAQDLLPEILEWAIRHGWSVLFDMGDKVEVETFVTMNFSAMSWLISPPHGRSYRLTLPTQNQIIKTIHDGEVLDWAARAMLRLNSAQSTFGDMSLKSISCFFASLANTVPQTELGRQFRDYVPDWQKFNMHLFVAGHGMPATPSSKHQQHYTSCMGTWQDIARYLGIELAVHNYTSINCFSPRCPRSYMAERALLGCADCARTIVYCDQRCQTTDWKLAGHHRLHRK